MVSLIKQRHLEKGKWLLFIGLLLSVATIGPSFAQEFPTKPINLIIGKAPGLSPDISSRFLASKAEKILGQPFVITNNGGGGGSVAYGIIAKAKPDGYHLVSDLSTSLVRIPHFRSVPYKLDDFAPIMSFGAIQSGLVVRTDSPWKTLKEFVDYAKKNPGKVTYASTGVGGAPHHAMEFIGKQEGGISWTHVPFSGDPMVALLGGHVTAYSGGTVFIPHVKAGSFRILVTHGEKRLKSFPEVPTLRELGYNFVNETMFLVVAPKGTPLPIVKKLEEALRKSMDEPGFVRHMEELENVIAFRNAEDTKNYLEDAYDRIGKLTKELKIPSEGEKK